MRRKEHVAFQLVGQQCIGGYQRRQWNFYLNMVVAVILRIEDHGAGHALQMRLRKAMAKRLP